MWTEVQIHLPGEKPEAVTEDEFAGSELDPHLVGKLDVERSLVNGLGHLAEDIVPACDIQGLMK